MDKKIDVNRFPSNTYINFTLPAHAGTYTAPADGWIVIQVALSGQNVYFGINSGNLRLNCPVYTTNNNQIPLCWSLPINKGEKVQFFYNATVKGVDTCRFYYAKCAVPKS